MVNGSLAVGGGASVIAVSWLWSTRGLGDINSSLWSTECVCVGCSCPTVGGYNWTDMIHAGNVADVYSVVPVVSVLGVVRVGCVHPALNGELKLACETANGSSAVVGELLADVSAFPGAVHVVGVSREASRCASLSLGELLTMCPAVE